MESRTCKTKKTKIRRSGNKVRCNPVWKRIGTKTFSFLEGLPYPTYTKDLLDARLYLTARFREIGWNIDKHFRLNTPTISGLLRPSGVLNIYAYDMTEKETEQFFMVIEEIHHLYPKISPYIYVKPRRTVC